MVWCREHWEGLEQGIWLQAQWEEECFPSPLHCARGTMCLRVTDWHPPSALPSPPPPHPGLCCSQSAHSCQEPFQSSASPPPRIRILRHPPTHAWNLPNNAAFGEGFSAPRNHFWNAHRRKGRRDATWHLSQAPSIGLPEVWALNKLALPQSQPGKASPIQTTSRALPASMWGGCPASCLSAFLALFLLRPRFQDQLSDQWMACWLCFI